MHPSMILVAIGAGAALVHGQAPPPPVELTATKSGVLPVLPTDFSGVETIEGAIVNDGPANPGFQPVNGVAPVQSALPAATYEAVLPSTNFDDLTGSTIMGSIVGVSTQGGSGVTFTVNFTGLPSESAYGPFVYHIHTLAVPIDGNCTETLGHLDPTDRGEYYPCNVAAPDTCQAGDLAGKHGNITSTPFVASYTDEYLSTDPSSPYFFGDLSVVIHTSNTTRLTCANFKQVGASTSTSSSGSNSTSSSSVGASSSSPQSYTGAASVVSAFGLGGAFAVVVVLGFLAVL